MSPAPPSPAADQVRHLVRVARSRRPAWIAGLLAIGLAVSVIGLGARLDLLCASLGERAFSSFGFAGDAAGQPVRWHPAADGLRVVRALRAEGADLDRELAADLDALAAALETAAGSGVASSPVLRLHGTDSLQSVATREQRSGSFG